LLLLDAGVADYPGPTLRLFLLELRHVRRAAATGQKMQLPVSFLDLRLVERRVNGPVELGNDGSRGFWWRADGVPGIREEPWVTCFDRGGTGGPFVERTRGCAREDPGLPPGVELVSRGKFRDHAAHRPADEVVKRRTRAAIGDMHHPGAEQLRELLAAQMRGGAGTLGCEGAPAGMGFGIDNECGPGLRGEVRRH